jgi:hypothetical protein
MNNRWLLLALVFSSAEVLASNRVETFVPKFQDRPFAATLPADERLSPVETAALIRERGRQLCEFFRKPSGNFRQRLMDGVSTNPYFDTSRTVALLERQGNSYRARLVQPREGTQWSTFTQVDCVGRN